MKTKHILITILCAISFTACELDFLPTAALSSDTMTKELYGSLLVGAYDGVQSSSMGLKFLADDTAADNLNTASWFTPMDRGVTTPDFSYILTWWNEYFSTIERCNNFILTVDGSDSPDSYTSMKGEACILRAYCYYRLSCLYGPVPIVLKRTLEPTPRNTEVEVWTQIKNDLEYGMANAPNFTNFAIANKAAAKALLARVFLVAPEGVRDLAKAKQYAEEIIALGTFKLATNYEDIFWKGTSSEFILAWKNTTNDNVSVGWFLRSNLTDPNPSSVTIDAGRYETPVDQSLMRAFEPGDQRTRISVRYIKTPSGSESWDCVKYPTQTPGNPNPVVRISEMYLTSAEAAGYPAGVARLNDVRVARGLPALEAGTDITASNFLYKIMAERRVEFCFESMRYYDLRRWFNSGAQGKADVLSFRTYQPGEPAGSRPTASDMFNIADNGYNLLLPIGSSAIANNPALAPNNPGY